MTWIFPSSTTAAWPPRGAGSGAAVLQRRVRRVVDANAGDRRVRRARETADDVDLPAERNGRRARSACRPEASSPAASACRRSGRRLRCSVRRGVDRVVLHDDCVRRARVRKLRGLRPGTDRGRPAEEDEQHAHLSDGGHASAPPPEVDENLCKLGTAAPSERSNAHCGPLLALLVVAGVAAGARVHVSLVGRPPALTAGTAWTAKLAVRPASFAGNVRVTATGPGRTTVRAQRQARLVPRAARPFQAGALDPERPRRRLFLTARRGHSAAPSRAAGVRQSDLGRRRTERLAPRRRERSRQGGPGRSGNRRKDRRRLGPLAAVLGRRDFLC